MNGQQWAKVCAQAKLGIDALKRVHSESSHRNWPIADAVQVREHLENAQQAVAAALDLMTERTTSEAHKAKAHKSS